MSPMFQTSQRSSKTTSSGGIKTSAKSQTIDDGLEECIEFICIPERPTPAPGHVQTEKLICPEPECPKGYEIVMDNHVPGQDVCAKYSCELMPLEDAVCNVTGKTFNTFDETEFKYDICDHILARDMVNDYWNVQSNVMVKPKNSIPKFIAKISVIFSSFEKLHCRQLCVQQGAYNQRQKGKFNNYPLHRPDRYARRL